MLKFSLDLLHYRLLPRRIDRNFAGRLHVHKHSANDERLWQLSDLRCPVLELCLDVLYHCLLSRRIDRDVEGHLHLHQQSTDDDWLG